MRLYCMRIDMVNLFIMFSYIYTLYMEKKLYKKNISLEKYRNNTKTI